MNSDPRERQKQPDLDAEYFEASEKMPPHAILFALEPFLNESGCAIDLGAGNGTASQFLLDRGYSVMAIDSSPEAVARLNRRFAKIPKVTILEADFSKIELPKSDVIVAGFSLFFVPRWRFGRLWKSVDNALSSGGLIAAQFLGKNDEWNDGKRTIHSSQTLQNLLKDFEILYWEEVDREGKTVVNKVKHWHIFHIVARKQ